MKNINNIMRMNISELVFLEGTKTTKRRKKGIKWKITNKTKYFCLLKFINYKNISKNLYMNC